MAVVGTIAAVAAAAAGVATTVHSMVQKPPSVPEIPKMAPAPSKALPLPTPPTVTPAPAPAPEVAEVDQKARQQAAIRMRQLSQQRSAASTVLTSPLGVTSTPANTSTAVLGR